MTTYILEMRSTANWQDVRYREYTTSAKKAEIFKDVPKIQFTDSGHGIVPAVREHVKGPREPRNMMLCDHVQDYIAAIGRKPAACHCGEGGHALNSVNCPVHGPRKADALSKLNHARAKRIDLLTAILKAVDYTLAVHGHIDAGTPLHDRIVAALPSQGGGK